MSNGLIHACPKCGGRHFYVVAYVSQDWVVDQNTDFVEQVNSCSQVFRLPSDDDIWVCKRCGHEDSGIMFVTDESHALPDPGAKEDGDTDGDEHFCLRCGNKVEVEPVLDYPYYCPECDENMYSFEVTTGASRKPSEHGTRERSILLTEAEIEFICFAMDSHINAAKRGFGSLWTSTTTMETELKETVKRKLAAIQSAKAKTARISAGQSNQAAGSAEGNGDLPVSLVRPPI